MNNHANPWQQRRGGLQRQLIFSLNAILFLVTATTLGYDYLKQRAILENTFQASMRQSIHHIQLALERSPSYGAAQATLQAFCEVMKGHEDSGHEISVRDSSGTVIATSRHTNAAIPPSKTWAPMATATADEKWQRFSYDEKTYYVLSVPFQLRDSESAGGHIRYIESTETVESVMAQSFRNRALTLIAAMAAASLLSWWILRKRILNPLDDLVMHAYRVSIGDRIVQDYQDPGNELGDLQRTFNRMVEQIEKHETDHVKKEKESAYTEASVETYLALVSRLEEIVKTSAGTANEGQGASSLMDDSASANPTKDCQMIIKELYKITESLKPGTPAMKETASCGDIPLKGHLLIAHEADK